MKTILVTPATNAISEKRTDNKLNYLLIKTIC